VGEPRYVCLSEAKVLHSHQMWTVVSSSVAHFLHRVPSEGAPPPGPPTWSLFRERCSIPRAPFIHLSKSPADKPSSRFPKWGPYGKRRPSPEPFLPILRGPARQPSLQVPFIELPQRETLHLQSSFQPHLKIPSRQEHSRLPNRAPIKRDAHPQSLPFITFRALSKGAPPPGSPKERCPVSRATLQLSLRVPGERTPHDT